MCVAIVRGQTAGRYKSREPYSVSASMRSILVGVPSCLTHETSMPVHPAAATHRTLRMHIQAKRSRLAQCVFEASKNLTLVTSSAMNVRTHNSVLHGQWGVKMLGAPKLMP